jgi:hypothetical protein
MPRITVDVSTEVAEALTRQARALLMARGAYVRAVLAAVTAQAVRPDHRGHERGEADHTYTMSSHTHTKEE